MVTKPYAIEAVYITSINYEVPDVEESLGINWKDVEEYTVRWGVLRLTMKDGQELECDRFEDRGEICWKKPYELNELNEDFERLEDLAEGGGG